jgi:hypothetical protein
VNRVVLIIMAVVSLLQEVGAVTLRWSAVDTAVDGSSIPALVIVYRVYWSSDDATWNFAAETDAVSLSLDAITSGCYFLYVTAVRTDSDQESVPSQSLQYCYGDIGGPEAVPDPAPPEEVYVQ